MSFKKRKKYYLNKKIYFKLIFVKKQFLNINKKLYLIYFRNVCFIDIILRYKRLN